MPRSYWFNGTSAKLLLCAKTLPLHSAQLKQRVA
jgi:hypothetical protein